MFEDPPVTVAVHPMLLEELKAMQSQIFEETKRKSLGGVTTYSKLAALQLRLIRTQGKSIWDELKKNHKNIDVKIIDGIEYVPYTLYKNLYIYSEVLSKKKDNKQIKVEIAKIKGIQKDEINILW